VIIKIIWIYIYWLGIMLVLYIHRNFALYIDQHILWANFVAINTAFLNESDLNWKYFNLENKQIVCRYVRKETIQLTNVRYVHITPLLLLGLVRIINHNIFNTINTRTYIGISIILNIINDRKLRGLGLYKIDNSQEERSMIYLI